MKKTSGILFIILILSAGNLFASLRIQLTAPTVQGGPYNGYDAATIQAALNAGITQFQTEIDNSDLSSLNNQDKMATSFADAAGYSAYSGSLDGYQGYDLFAFIAGVSTGIQVPSISLNAQNMIDDIENELKENKDASVGAGASGSINLGLNITPLKKKIGLRRVLRNRMYINFKYFTFSKDIEDYSFETTTYGIGLNYQLIDRKGGRFRLFKWTGLSVGTGFIHNKNDITMKMDFDEYRSDPIVIQADTMYAQMGFTPETTFNLDITSNVIPVDISTSLRILWIFNFTLGAGMDFTFGRSKIKANAVSDMKAYYCNTEGGTYTEIETAPGSGGAVIDADTSGEPALTHFRVTAGAGICLGPVPVDVKVNYYPVDDGVSVNVSTGVVW